jgi:hypothetical protein
MTTATIDLISIVNNEVLELNYLCKTPQVIYSVADFAGNVLMRGNYNCLENNKLSITGLPKGMFTLCIIDGDSLTKAHFQKD